jgi:hypothetical protein
MDRCAGIWTIFVCYKKSVTEGFVYGALSMIENKTKESPLPIVEQAFENVMPTMTPKGQLPANFHCRWAILPRRYRQAYRPWSGAPSLRQTLRHSLTEYRCHTQRSHYRAGRAWRPQIGRLSLMSMFLAPAARAMMASLSAS